MRDVLEFGVENFVYCSGFGSLLLVGKFSHCLKHPTV